MEWPQINTDQTDEKFMICIDLCSSVAELVGQ
jgi:hypothetical protein